MSRLATAMIACAVAAPTFAHDIAFVETGRFDLPLTSFDILDDGRLIGLIGSDILVQSAPNANTYTTIATIDASFLSSFGASFIAVSPDQQRLAIGDNNFGDPGEASVGIFDLAGNTLATIAAPNFAGDWADDNTLFVSGGTFADTNLITRIDVAASAATTAINDFAGFSAAVAISEGQLFTANGFSIGGPTDSQTGDVRAFALADLTGTPPLSFELDGSPVASALSAGSIDFDAQGNLIIGGGDAFGSPPDAGTIALITPAGTRFDLASPFASDFNLARYNDATEELIVFNGSGTAVRYAIVPTPATITATIALLSLAPARRGRRA